MQSLLQEASYPNLPYRLAHRAHLVTCTPTIQYHSVERVRLEEKENNRMCEIERVKSGSYNLMPSLYFTLFMNRNFHRPNSIFHLLYIRQMYFYVRLGQNAPVVTIRIWYKRNETHYQARFYCSNFCIFLH